MCIEEGAYENPAAEGFKFGLHHHLPPSYIPYGRRLGGGYVVSPARLKHRQNPKGGGDRKCHKLSQIVVTFYDECYDECYDDL